MKLRTGVALQLLALLLVALAVLGVFVVRQTREGLIAQVDERLDGAIAQRLRSLSSADDRPARTDRTDYPATATIVFRSDGTVAQHRPSGVDDVADPFPLVTAAWARGHLEEVATVPATRGTLHYRATAARMADGRILVEAAPLRSVGPSVARLQRTYLLGAAGVLALAGLAAAWLVTRSLRPLTRIAASATAVAGGDRSRLVSVPTPYRELRQLGASLDEMVAELTAAIAERERVLALEAASQEHLRRFAADASHELQTPITSIRGWAELYRRGGLGEREALDAAMQRIEREASRMGRLVDDLLQLTRNAEVPVRDRRLVDLAAVSHDAVAAAEAIDASRRVTLDVAGTDLWIAGDEDRLRQVVDNLLANIRAHTPPGTHASITLGRAGVRGREEVVLTAADDGAGFPPDALDDVFERFWRGASRRDEARPTSGGGADGYRRTGHGLGLAIVRSIVAAHGGTVSAANASPHGAVVTVRLPLAPPRPEPAP